MERRQRLGGGQGLLAQSFECSERHTRVDRGSLECGGFERDAAPKRNDGDRHCQQPGFADAEDLHAAFFASTMPFSSD